MFFFSHFSRLSSTSSSTYTPTFIRPTCLDNQVTISAISALFDAKNLNSISKYQTDNAFLYAEFTNVACGVFGHASCPGETLHCHLSGIMQYQVECLVRMVGNVKRKKTKQDHRT